MLAALRFSSKNGWFDLIKFIEARFLLGYRATTAG